MALINSFVFLRSSKPKILDVLNSHEHLNPERSMKDSFLTLLQLFSATGGITGRKKCQKLVHILQECGSDFDLNFDLALYSTYSSGLQSLMDSLVEEEYLHQEPETGGVFPTTRFSHHASEWTRSFKNSGKPRHRTGSFGSLPD